MAFANIENLSNSSMPTKAKAKRKRKAFRLNAKKRDGGVPQFHRPAEKGLRSTRVALVIHPDRGACLPEHMKSTTARVNDGMSFTW